MLIEHSNGLLLVKFPAAQARPGSCRGLTNILQTENQLLALPHLWKTSQMSNPDQPLAEQRCTQSSC